MKKRLVSLPDELDDLCKFLAYSHHAPTVSEFIRRLLVEYIEKNPIRQGRYDDYLVKMENKRKAKEPSYPKDIQSISNRKEEEQKPKAEKVEEKKSDRYEEPEDLF
jgi:hypothetical protein